MFTTVVFDTTEREDARHRKGIMSGWSLVSKTKHHICFWPGPKQARTSLFNLSFLVTNADCNLCLLQMHQCKTCIAEQGEDSSDKGRPSGPSKPRGYRLNFQAMIPFAFVCLRSARQESLANNNAGQRRPGTGIAPSPSSHYWPTLSSFAFAEMAGIQQ
jgi:hypothetical protein